MLKNASHIVWWSVLLCRYSRSAHVSSVAVGNGESSRSADGAFGSTRWLHVFQVAPCFPRAADGAITCHIINKSVARANVHSWSREAWGEKKRRAADESGRGTGWKGGGTEETEEGSISSTDRLPLEGCRQYASSGQEDRHYLRHAVSMPQVVPKHVPIEACRQYASSGTDQVSLEAG